MRVLSTFHVKGRGKVVTLALGEDCALAEPGNYVTHGGERYLIAGVERTRDNRPLRPGSKVGLLLRPEPEWGEGAEVTFVAVTMEHE